MPRRRVLTLVLAGGEGGRLEVLTEQRAKPAMPYAGVYRLIDFTLSNCIHSGLTDVWVVQQYQPHALSDHLSNGRPWDLDRTRGGLRVLQPYLGGRSESGWYRGNADAIYRNKAEIELFDPDLLLVLSADHVYKLDYGDVVARHQESGGDVTMVTTQVPIAEAGRFGTVEVDTSGRVSRFEYKPERPQSDLVTTEVFVYDARKLLETLEELASESGAAADDDDDDDEASFADFGDALIPRLVEAGRAYDYRLEGYWRDVGTVASYWQGHMELVGEEPALRLDDPRWPILTASVQRPPARVDSSARIDDSLVSPGCRIAGSVSRSVLAPGVVVEEGATVSDSILLEGTVVAGGATVGCAVLDMNVRVGRGATVGTAHRQGDACDDSQITLVGEEAEIDAETAVEAGARVELRAVVKDAGG